MKIVVAPTLLTAALTVPANAHADCGDPGQDPCIGPVPTVDQVVGIMQQLTDPNIQVFELQFHTPAGYVVETLPATQTVNPGVVKYEISMTQQPGSVTVKRQLLVNAVLIPVQSYPALRQFFHTVKSDDDAQVVFQNAQNARNN